jgi:prepilin-type N-terminal cleavage/methylation domain-containing protein
MAFKKRVPKNGFTLLETLVSLFLLVLIVSATATWGIDSLRFYVRHNRQIDAQLRAVHAFEQMRSEIMFAKVLLLEPNRIQIENLNDHQKITWDISGGRIRRVAGSTAYFTLPEDPAQALEFSQLAPNLLQINQSLLCLRNPS